MEKRSDVLRSLVETVDNQWNDDIGLECRDERDSIAAAAVAFDDMLEALRALDKFWTDEFPKGPDVPAPFPNPDVRLGEDTIAIWKQIRAAIANAEGK